MARTLYLRTRDGTNTLVDIEVTGRTELDIDVKSVVCIAPYSELLLATNEQKRDELIFDFGRLHDLRGWYHEWWLAVVMKGGPVTIKVVLDEVRQMLHCIAAKYGLTYSED